MGAIKTDLPTADEGRAWDSGEAIARVKEWATDGDSIDFAKYRRAFFWVDPENKDEQGGYKLPFADVIDGELQAVWSGVAAAMGALMGARGGVDIPDADRPGVYAAIAVYYKKFDKDPPMMGDKSSERKAVNAEIVEKDTSTGGFTAIASTSTEDRHGECVDVNGWDLKDFKNNPVLLWAHDHSQMAIGKATKIWTQDGKLMFNGIFQTATDLGRAAKQLVSDGILKSFSVGFMPMEMDGNTYTKQQLLEISLVNVPANPDAQMLAYKSLKGAGFESGTIKGFGIHTEVLDRLEALEKDVSKLTDQVNSEAKAQDAAAPIPRPGNALTRKQMLVKAVVRAADQLLAGEKKGIPKKERVELQKIIKRAGEQLSAKHKGELKNGANS